MTVQKCQEQYSMAFKRELSKLLDSIDNRTPQEFVRYLKNLVVTAEKDLCPACKTTGIVNHGVDGMSYCSCENGKDLIKQHQKALQNS